VAMLTGEIEQGEHLNNQKRLLDCTSNVGLKSKTFSGPHLECGVFLCGGAFFDMVCGPIRKTRFAGGFSEEKLSPNSGSDYACNTKPQSAYSPPLSIK